LLAAVLVVAPLGAVAAAGAPPSVPPPSTAHPGAGVDFVNVSALTTLGYDPNGFTVHPGDSVRLVVTQLANFAHNFVLSPLPNFTFSTSATADNLTSFFAAHTPLVNLTLSSTVGSRVFANFTAPGAGSYEFVCLQPTHFQSGMHGEMTSTTASSAPSSSSSSPLLLIAAGAIVGLIVVLAVVFLVRRRKASPPPP
jgi:uncharacterized cupredoxin-like copper-binding protein